jgi:hypothetical protein
VNFTQIISVRSANPDRLVELTTQWDANQADTDIMGYIGAHVLADRDNPGHYLIVAEFAEVEPGVPASQEAARNDERAETQQWLRWLLETIEGEPEYGNYDELYRTG